MIFNTTTILGSSTQYEYFGDLYNYRKKRTLEVEGFLIDPEVIEGDADLESIEGYLSGDTLDSFTINGQDFGYGKLTKISFSDDDFIPNLKKVNATIEIYEETTADFLVAEPTAFLENLSETFSFAESTSGKDFTYSVAIKYLNDSGLSLAHDLALALIEEALSDGSLITGFDPSEYKVYPTESIDLISNSYSLSQQYQFIKNGEGDLAYDYTLSTDINIGQDGITTVSENGVVRGIKGETAELILKEAEDGLTALIEESYERSSGAFTGFFGEEDTPHPLFDKKISLNKIYDKSTSTITYVVVYSNDPSVEFEGSWSYSNEISKSDGFYTVSESGKIIGDGIPFEAGVVSSLEKAKTIWLRVSGGIPARLEGLYGKSTTSITKLLFLSEDINYSEIDGSITYNVAWSTSSGKEGDGDITTKNTLTNSYAVELKNNFIILNDQEISQKLDLNTTGRTRLTMDLKGKKETTFGDYIGFVNANMGKYKPNNELIHISSSPQVSFNPNKNSLTFSIDWTWLLDSESQSGGQTSQSEGQTIEEINLGPRP